MKAIVNFLATAWIASGALLLGAPSLHAEPLVYVPLGSESKIAIIDAAKDQIIGIIDGLQAVHGLSGTPDGRFLIAGRALSEENCLMVICSSTSLRA
ncbi:hypothetical protein [Candidatus Nitrotoga sp. M5]|uniref:hypothetical protein n=1 Tax=Candidatus Nitrotoga sp. M5 TaxID=2890409 RepID=UPI001EF5EE48|nr:hypothetical protein [Candidatus Nitrotoga sp. M5]CAH1387956.1 hypothetical protein NTGM5_750028 [Candidatus Nitrotoga sp. M5]